MINQFQRKSGTLLLKDQERRKYTKLIVDLSLQARKIGMTRRLQMLPMSLILKVIHSFIRHCRSIKALTIELLKDRGSSTNLISITLLVLSMDLSLMHQLSINLKTLVLLIVSRISSSRSSKEQLPSWKSFRRLANSLTLN